MLFRSKATRTIAGRTILQRVIDRVGPQCSSLILNANGDPARFSDYGLTVVPDDVQGFAGPLAGILAALDWTAQHRPETEWVVSAAADCPFLPRDLVARFHAFRREEDAKLCVARSDGQTHPVIGLWSVSLRHDLRKEIGRAHV